MSKLDFSSIRSADIRRELASRQSGRSAAKGRPMAPSVREVKEIFESSLQKNKTAFIEAINDVPGMFDAEVKPDGGIYVSHGDDPEQVDPEWMEGSIQDVEVVKSSSDIIVHLVWGNWGDLSPQDTIPAVKKLIPDAIAALKAKGWATTAKVAYVGDGDVSITLSH